MATETGPDLSTAREQVRLLMDDTCRIVRYERAEKEILDQETLEVRTFAGEPTTVYEGRCKTAQQGTGLLTRTADEGKRQRTNDYKISLPFDAEYDDGSGAVPYSPKEGDEVEILTVRTNTALVGRKFRVKEFAITTFHVQWKLSCELREGE